MFVEDTLPESGRDLVTRLTDGECNELAHDLSRVPKVWLKKK
jgi:hypothetical protein